MNGLLQKLLDAGILTKCDEASYGIEVKFEGRMSLMNEELQQSNAEQLYRIFRVRLLVHFDGMMDRVMNPEDYK